MIEVNNNFIDESIPNIIAELRSQLSLNGITRFEKSMISGDNFLTQCPFHKNGQERKPSFGILMRDKNGKKEGTCHCFRCNYSASLPEMISDCFGRTDFGLFGSQWLVKNFLSVAIERRQDVVLDFNRGCSSDIHSSDYVTEDELDKYREYHEYMWQRGLTPELVELFDIGYNKETDSITFPIRDIKGNCLFVAERSVKTKYFHLKENAIKPLYGLYELNLLNSLNNEVYVCEGVFDALSFWRVGKRALCLLGLGNEYQIKQLNNLPTREIILALDNDNAGQDAIQKLKKRLPRKILKQVIYPNGRKDAGECTDEELISLKEILL